MPTVIKAGQAGSLARKLSTVDLADHLREAADIMEQARVEADAIRTHAEAVARKHAEVTQEQARREGFERGYAEGVTAGREAAFREARVEFDCKHVQLASTFQSAVEQIESMKERLRLDAQKDVLDFALLVASKLTLDVGELRRDAAVENFRRCLALVSDRTQVSVRCNPADVESLRTFAGGVGNAVQGAHVRLVEDASISPGGCLVQYGGGEVDGTLETQIAEVTAILTGRRSDG